MYVKSLMRCCFTLQIDDEDLDEEDLDLLEENTGIKLNRASGVSC